MWKVFKVKQRAAHLYTEKVKDSLLRGENMFASSILDKTTQTELREAAGHVEEFVRTRGAGYNWPYDFFSLIELIKLENKVDFEVNVTREEDQAENIPEAAAARPSGLKPEQD